MPDMMKEAGKSTTTIVLARHGESTDNATGLMAGNGDLTPKGRQQAEELGRRLADFPITAVYASPLRRAIQTAELTIPMQADTIQVREGLHEQYLGTEAENHQQTREGFKEDALSNFDLLRHAVTTYGPEVLGDLALVQGMETERESQQRIAQTLLEIAQEHPGETVLAVSHGYIMRKLLMHLGYGTRRELQTGTIQNTAYIVLQIKGDKITVKETSGIEKTKDDGLSDTVEGVASLYFKI